MHLHKSITDKWVNVHKSILEIKHIYFAMHYILIELYRSDVINGLYKDNGHNAFYVNSRTALETTQNCLGFKLLILGYTDITHCSNI